MNYYEAIEDYIIEDYIIEDYVYKQVSIKY